MSCQDRKQDLLLLAHGALSGPRRTLLDLHLRRCPYCQEQQKSYAVLSQALATAIRPDEMPRWRPPAPPERSASAGRPTHWALAAVLALLVAIAAAAGTVWVPDQPWCPTWLGGHSGGSGNCGQSSPSPVLNVSRRAPADGPARTQKGGANPSNTPAAPAH